MATNGTIDPLAMDVEANEETTLLDSSQPSPDPSEMTAASENEQFWAEFDRPWPATFERSVSLLASPVISFKNADLYTKSPKPGNTPLSARKFQRGYETPQGTLMPPLKRNNTIDNKFQKIGGEKIQSLDFKTISANLKSDHANLTSLSTAQKEQTRKAKEAAEYRAKLLQQSSRHDNGEHSPGAAREKASMKQYKQRRDDANLKEENFEDKATFMQCIFNLANILMGVGLLGLPFAFASAGWLGGSFALLAFSFVTWRTSIMIGRELNGDPRPAACFDDSPFKTPLPPGSVPQARMRRPIRSFPEIAREAFGQTGAVILSIVLYFELFSCLCIYIVTIGDHLHTLFPAISTARCMVGVAFAAAAPIILLKTARLLSYLSMVGTFATVAVVSAVVMTALLQGDITEEVAAKTEGAEPPYHVLWNAPGLPMSFGLIAYCFSGHAIVPSIYSSMRKPQDYERVVDMTYLIVVVACFAVGASGYWMFGDLVRDQVTLSLENNSSAKLAMTVLTYLMVLTAYSKITLTMFPLALGIEEIVAPYLSSEGASEFASSTIKMTLLALALVVSIYCPSFSFLCELVGMICTMTVSVIFPAAAHLKLFGPKLNLLDTLMDYTFVIVGTVIAVVGTYVALS